MLNRFELLPSGVFRRDEAFSRNPSVGEVAVGHGHAAHVQALHQARLKLVAEDEFGAAAADVHHQARFVAGDGLQRVRHAKVDETRLFAPANDLHLVAKRPLGRFEEFFAVAGHSQRVGAHHTHVLRWQVTYALTEALQASQGAVRHRWRKFVAGVQPFGQPHHFLVPVHHLQAPVAGRRGLGGAPVAGNDQVKAVGAEIKRGVGLVGGIGLLAVTRHERAARRRAPVSNRQSA